MFAGAAVMTIFWAVTPLLGAVFVKSVITRSTTALATTTASLLPLRDQENKPDIGILSAAYGSIWLGQAMPAFTTAKAAFSPFKIDSDSFSFTTNVSLTARTSMYSTTLKCEPAAIGTTNSPGFIFDDGKGCRTDGIQWTSRSNKYTALYIGFYNDPLVDWSLEYLGCPANASHTFLAIWAKDNASTIEGINALFCRPEYWVQSVNVTIVVPDRIITDAIPLAPPSLLPDDVFNASAFEYVIGSGVGSAPPRADIPQTTNIQQSPRIQNMSISWPTTNMVGFALGISRLQPAQYLNATTLASSFEDAHKLLFALAISNLMTTNLSSTDSRVAMIQDNVSAVVVIRVLAITIEVLFGLITVLALALLWISRTRPSQLESDPASLIDIMRIVVQPSLDRNICLDNSVYIRDEANIRLNKGKLTNWARISNTEQESEKVSIGGFSQVGVLQPLSVQKPDPKLIRPKEMTLTIAALFISVLLLAVATLVIVQIKIQELTGLALPAKNPVVVQLILNYVPIAFATFLEPFWILLNRLLCILKPFEELRKGEAKLSKSLALEYTSLPPQLVFWRGFHAGHYLLVAVCAMGLSANLLTVALGAIFETNLTHLSLDGNFEVGFLPQFNRTAPRILETDATDYFEHFYVAKSNITNKTPLPPWISTKNFFLPVKLNTTSNLGDVQFSKVKTQGFGVDVRCTQLDVPESNISVSLNVTGNGAADSDTSISAQNVAIVRVQGLDGRNFSCMSSKIDKISVRNESVESAAEVTSSLVVVDPDSSANQAAFCSSMLLVGFLRIKGSEAALKSSTPEELQVPHQGQPEALWLGCRPTMQTGNFEVTVDPNGLVLNSRSIGPFTTNLSSFFTNDKNTTTLYNTMNSLIASNPGLFTETALFWHNDTFADTWLPYLIKTFLNSTDFLSSSASIPSVVSMAPVVEEIYMRLFSIILGLNTDMFLPAPRGTTTPGTITVSCTRVFMSQSMYVIATSLLSVNVLVAITYYIKRPKRMLPRMPITIASVLQLFEGSGLVTEAQTSGRDCEEWRIGYGKFVGTDGKPHVGIERRPFVIPWADG